MDMLALGAVGVVAALFAVMVRQRAPEMALVLAMAACVLLHIRRGRTGKG